MTYPRRARQRGWEGLVVLSVEIDARGAVVAVVVVRSSGFATLDRAAVEGARRWRFRPALRDGHPVRATLTRRVLFRLARRSDDGS